MMISCKTFFKVNDDLVKAEDFQGEFVDLDYIEGSIEMSANGVVVLDRRFVDCIDDLWAYMLEGVAAITLGRDFETYFPDQPIKIKFNNVGSNKISISTCVPKKREIKAVVNFDEFLDALLKGAEEFFNILSVCVGSENYKSELKMIKDILSGDRSIIENYVYR